MLILLPLETPRKELNNIIERIKSFGCTPHEIPGEINLAVGITGNTSQLSENEFQLMPYVIRVIRVSKKYKLASREMIPQDTIINIDGTKIGGEFLSIIAGPCSIESRDQAFETAGKLKEAGIRLFRGGAYKPRSSPYAFQGMKEKGLLILSEIRKELGMVIITELLNPSNLEAVAETADIIQIGARNMQNFALLEEAGATGKPIILKRGLSATVEELLMSAEYILSQNNFNLALCERGIRTFETSTRNTLDLNSIPVIRKNTHLPILADPSHGVGISEFVPDMALASIAAGAQGLMIEVHPDPINALSDGYQSLTPIQFSQLMERIRSFAGFFNKELQ